MAFGHLFSVATMTLLLILCMTVCCCWKAVTSKSLIVQAPKEINRRSLVSPLRHRFLEEQEYADNQQDYGDDEQQQNYGEGEEEQQDYEEEDEQEEQEEQKEEESRNSRDQDDDRPRYVDDFYAYPEDEVLKLFPLSERDVIGFTLASISVTLAAGAGVGGGGMVLPIYMLVLEMPPSIASPLSAVTVFGGALSVTLWNLARRHPLADRPLIDWDMVLVMEPVILVGTILGTMLHQALSEQVLVVLLVVLLGFAAHQTLNKAKVMYRAEVEYIEKRKALAAAALEMQVDSQIDNNTLTLNTDALDNGSSNTSSSTSDLLQKMALTEQEKNEIRILNPDYVTLVSELAADEKYTSSYKIVAVCCMFTVAIFLNTMLGGGGFESPWGIYCGGMVFWLVHIILFTFLLAFAWAAQTYVVNKHEIKELANFGFVHGDVKWDTRSAIVYPFVFLCAGLFAGMFGIGGGLVTVPLMLVMGVHPDVATATSSCMILFTSLASATSFAVFGLIHWDYAGACVIIGFFASLFGKKIMYQAKKNKVDGVKFMRNSFIAYAVGGVLLLSGLLLTIQYIFIIEGLGEKEAGGICYNSRI